MTGIVNSTGAKSGIIGTTVGTPAGGSWKLIRTDTGSGNPWIVDGWLTSDYRVYKLYFYNVDSGRDQGQTIRLQMRPHPTTNPHFVVGTTENPGSTSTFHSSGGTNEVDLFANSSPDSDRMAYGEVTLFDFHNTGVMPVGMFEGFSQGGDSGNTEHATRTWGGFRMQTGEAKTGFHLESGYTVTGTVWIFALNESSSTANKTG